MTIVPVVRELLIELFAEQFANAMFNCHRIMDRHLSVANLEQQQLLTNDAIQMMNANDG